MGFFDDAVNESVPGGDLAKPLMIAAGALILGHLFGGKHEAAAPPPAPGQRAAGQGPDRAAEAASGGFLGGGLGNLAGSLGGALGGAGGGMGGVGGMLGNLASSPIGGALAGAGAATVVGGGLNSLLQKFRDAGHGGAAESWVGQGANQPLSADQVNQAIGQDKIAEIAQQAGISPDQMSQLLAQALPKLVDKLTPGGQLPQG